MTISNVLFGDWPMHSRATRWWASTQCQCPHQLKILMRKKRWDHYHRRHLHHHHNNIGIGITLSSESYCHRLQLTSCHLASLLLKDFGVRTITIFITTSWFYLFGPNLDKWSIQMYPNSTNDDDLHSRLSYCHHSHPRHIQSSQLRRTMRKTKRRIRQQRCLQLKQRWVE